MLFSPFLILYIMYYRDGAGRTGAYISLDIVLDNIRDRGTVDILSTICGIRKFRPFLLDHLVGLIKYF